MGEIFEPVICAIEKLVAEQVDKARVKRLSLNHPKGDAIKVCTAQCSIFPLLTAILGNLLSGWFRCKSIP